MTVSGSCIPPVPKKKTHKKQKSTATDLLTRVMHAIHAIIPPIIRPHQRKASTIELLEYLHNVIITMVLPVAPLCRNIVPFFDRAQNSGGIINSAFVIRDVDRY